MEQGSEHSATVKVFRYRWVILLIFCLYAAVNFLQFLQYTIISNITTKYYDVNDTFVELTGLMFMICFIVFCFPANYFIEKYNLRTIAIFSSGLTALGTLVKLLSVSPDRFYVVLIGQALCAIAQVFMLSIPSKLASTWFGAGEVSTACALAVFGTQIGVALGSVFSSNTVRDSDNMDDIRDDFMMVQIINASAATAIFLLVLIFFRAKPRLPPSQSQVELVETEITIKGTVKAMATNKDYLLILLSIGSTNGMYTAFGIVINNVYQNYFPGYQSELGIIVAMAVVAGGCVGSVVFGYLLDRWHRFKLTSFAIIIMAAVMYIFVALTLELGVQLATYFSIPLFGFFIASTLLVGFEFVTEVTYPLPEAACCSLLSTCIYIFTIIYTLAFDAIMDISDIAVHIVTVVLLVLNACIIHFISPRLRRREANMKTQ